MATLVSSLDSVFEGNELLSQISDLVGSLTTVSTMVTQLIDNPPDDLSELEGLLNGISLPNFDIGGDFASGLNGLKDMLPGDLSSLTDGLTSGLGNLEMTVVGELSGVIGDSVKAIQAIYKVTQLDFTCENGDAADGSSGESPGVSPEALPGRESEGNPGAEPGGNPGIHPGIAVERLMREVLPFARRFAPEAEDAEDGEDGDDAPGAEILAELNSMLDALPASLDVKTIVSFLAAGSDLGKNLPFRLPILDDLHEPLETLLKWDAMDAGELSARLLTTLDEIALFISGGIQRAMAPVLVDIPAAAVHIDMVEMARIAGDLTTRLTEVSGAVAGGDISGSGPAVTAISTLLDQYAVLRGAFSTHAAAKLPAIDAGLQHMPDQLEDAMCTLVSVLQPGNTAASLDSLLSGNLDFGTGGAEEVEKILEKFVDWFRALADKIDLEALKEPLQTVAQGAQAAVDGLDNGMVQLTLAVQSVFGQLETLLDAVDVEAVTTTVENTIKTFQTQLEQFTSVLENVANGVKTAVTTVKSAVEAIDVQEIINTLKSLFQGLTSVLENETVVDTLTTIGNTLDTMTKAVEELAFEPVTDQVVGLIEGVTDVLQTVNSMPLPGDLEQELDAAIAKLPGDISPATGALVDAFDDLVQSGPVKSLEEFSIRCRQFFEKVKEFDPGELIGDSMTKPYRELLAKIEPFSPGKMLEPLQAILEQLKERLKENANPGQLLEPLEPMFDEISQAFEQLDPEKLVEPLEEIVTGVIDTILEVLPVDDFFDTMEGVTDGIKNVVSFGESIKALVERVHNLLTGFTDAEGQINTWVNTILDKVNFSGGSGQLAAVAAALEGTKAAALTDRFNVVLDPVFADLTTLAPRETWTALVQAYRGISMQSLAALPGSPVKTALTTALAHIEPLDAEFNAPFQCLETWGETLTAAKNEFQAALTDWDSSYHGTAGPLAGFVSPGLDTAQLRQMMRDTIDAQVINPLKPLFAMAGIIDQTVGTIMEQLQELITIIQDKFASLLLGTDDSLESIIDSLKGLIQKLRDFNLDFITESLETVFDKVRDKLEAISPKRLREKIDELFNQLLDLISIDLLISPEDIAQLDADFKEVLDKFKAMDPETVITEVFQKEFDEKIVPMLEIFDLSKFFDVLLERLQVLNEELQTEMVRVNGAYRDMRQSLD
ncbi:MAG: hypothetical protein GY765_10815 [bacterium]|nr:hypothetical protein [bacterium]